MAHISSLLALINDAAKTLARAYVEENGHVPSLDETEPHPLDAQLSSPTMREAVQVLEGACAQLCATLARPQHTVLNHFFLTALDPSCTSVALEFKIADILHESPTGMHIETIAQRCGGEPTKLARILRLLAAKHCFREVEHNVFANNRVSIQLLASNPIHSLGLHMTGDATKAASRLAETLADRDVGASLDPAQSAWNRYTGQPLAMFDYWDQNPGLGHGERFGIAMLGWGTAVEASAVVHAYPWSALPPGASVCDLGGGVGAMAMQLARAHPHLHIKLQDLPDRISQAQNVVWPQSCPQAIAEHRVQFESIDFLVQRPIEGCDVYYLKNILHAFPAAECRAILARVRSAMKPGSRVLIHEYALQTPRTSASVQAPDPLLHNHGQGRIRQYYLDVSLMALLNGGERTLEEYIQLGEQAGLRFVKLWDFGDMSGVEFDLQQQRSML
ncbi:Methyltransf-2 domain-containing protein [Mycena kentingensis (nom. inval.)]|nr:Methyltransf-2 domain-containing protein [Mycena kentingensis (nom. inval.)]